MSEESANPSVGERVFPLPEGYDAVAEAKRLLRSVRAGALATAALDGFPFASLVNVATDYDGSPLLLMSGLSAHTRHLEAEPRASILLAETGKGDPLAHARLTVTGRAGRLQEEALRARARGRFLARHPKAALYADFGDFSFWRLEIMRAHLNGGFARAATFEGDAVRTDTSDAQDLMNVEVSAIDHMNADHAEAARLYATRLCGAADGRWRVTGLDPDGVDLACGDATARADFHRRVTDAAALRAALADLAAAARAR